MKKLTITFVFAFFFWINANAQITSAASGNWSDASTWTGNVVPTSGDNVQISAGTEITVDNVYAQCANISFGSTTAKLAMASGSVLSVYGNFSLYDTTHIVFSSWAPGAKLKFAGSANQTLYGWPFSTTLASTSLMEVVVDKSGGQLATSGGDKKINIGTSFDVINGTFLLTSPDDIQGRNIDGSAATTPTITIQSGGTFTIVGGASHIGSGTTGTPRPAIGKVTIFGNMVVSSTSTNKINFGNTDIEAGGVLEINTGGSNTAFNPGVLTVKSGGTLLNSTTTNIWHSTASLVLNSGGVFKTTTTTTQLPSNLTDNGTFLYARNSLNSDQTIVDRNYNRIECSFANGTSKKIWTVSATRSIADSLEINNSAVLQITAASPKSVTLNRTLRLTTGNLDISSPNITFNIASGDTISRATGTITGNPVFAGNNTVRYTSTTSSVTTGNELPASIANLQIISSGQTVTLGSNTTVNGTLTLSTGTFDNNGDSDDKVLSLGNGANIRRATGTLSVAPTFGTNVNLAYISTVSSVSSGPELPASPSVLNNLTIESNQGVTLSADVTVNGTLSFQSGSTTLTTGANTLTLASGASLTGEDADSYVIGNLATTQSVGTSASSLGGVGVSLNAGTDDLGSVTVTRVTGAGGIVTANSNQGIARKWTISSDNPPASGREITFNWNSSDDNGKVFSSSNKAQVWKYNGSTWDAVGTAQDVSGSDPRSVTVTASSFSQWSVSDENSPLPVELVSFSAKSTGKNILLRWSTATEVNNSGFEIERSGADKTNWKSIGFKEGTGTSNTVTTYSYADQVSAGKYYYRLKQLDRNGDFHYSKVIEAVSQSVPAAFRMEQNFPNPFNPATRISYQLPGDGFVSLKVYNILGEEVSTLVNEIQPAGEYAAQFDASKLTSGIYFYTIHTAQFTKTMKMLLVK
ncbi:MAG: T9SS type A sorting domain-containing protein [Bacteroidetes bacterium]|nr:T9SS type A sorting domain-containing protein [Bacteroidota bacterium]